MAVLSFFHRSAAAFLELLLACRRCTSLSANSSSSCAEVKDARALGKLGADCSPDAIAGIASSQDGSPPRYPLYAY